MSFDISVRSVAINKGSNSSTNTIGREDLEIGNSFLLAFLKKNANVNRSLGVDSLGNDVIKVTVSPTPSAPLHGRRDSLECMRPKNPHRRLSLAPEDALAHTRHERYWKRNSLRSVDEHVGCGKNETPIW